jgi:hypothetical protein
MSKLPVDPHKLTAPLIAALLATCLLQISCMLFPEASFQLAPQSRLPRWFTLPPGLSRSDVSVTMSYFTSPSGRTAKFVLVNVRTKHTLATVDATLMGSEPIQLKKRPEGFPPGYPAYEAITARGITEVIEHRRMEPIFYITDDANVLSELGLGDVH